MVATSLVRRQHRPHRGARRSAVWLAETAAGVDKLVIMLTDPSGTRHTGALGCESAVPQLMNAQAAAPNRASSCGRGGDCGPRAAAAALVPCLLVKLSRRRSCDHAAGHALTPQLKRSRRSSSDHAAAQAITPQLIRSRRSSYAHAAAQAITPQLIRSRRSSSNHAAWHGTGALGLPLVVASPVPFDSLLERRHARSHLSQLLSE